MVEFVARTRTTGKVTSITIPKRLTDTGQLTPHKYYLFSAIEITK